MNDDFLSLRARPVLRLSFLTLSILLYEILVRHKNPQKLGLRSGM